MNRSRTENAKFVELILKGTLRAKPFTPRAGSFTLRLGGWLRIGDRDLGKEQTIRVVLPRGRSISFVMNRQGVCITRGTAKGRYRPHARFNWSEFIDIELPESGNEPRRVKRR